MCQSTHFRQRGADRFASEFQQFQQMTDLNQRLTDRLSRMERIMQHVVRRDHTFAVSRLNLPLALNL